ncbi:30S ribosomal protein S9 [Patescibacteria group bacterium]|nr:30S ribosomal protein S9 [Patescibacteria group bacterium]MBU4115883.1 30S ribosomal protein S9 [Patescibacteria group bacterium]
MTKEIKEVKKITKISKPNLEQTKKKFLQEIGRRKTSVAIVRATENIKAKNEFTINDLKLEDYFKTDKLQNTVRSPLLKIKPKEKFSFSVKVKGGGTSSQAEAVRHGLSRILSILNEEYKKKLKKAGFLKRDSRAKERRKFGLKKARKAAQWSKR